VTRSEVERAFEQHKDAVFRFAWRMSASAPAAEDITQEVFLGLLRGTVRFDPARGPLRAFLLGVTRHITLKRLRADARWESIDEEQFVAVPLAGDEFEVGELVGLAVASLPPAQREVLILAEYEDCSLDEIAQAVETSIGAVKSRLHRARENLRRMLAPLRAGGPSRECS
jgi:RNA polymerase sigma-70 factor (ECF subfamily)